MSPRLGRSLPPRLAALAAAVDRGSRVADVGSDHGLLPLRLAASRRAVFCLATEKTEALAARIARPPAGASWAHRLRYRGGDGLAALRPEDAVDTVVIAGVGAATIVAILAALPRLRPSPARLVLQPRTDEAALRRWLSAHRWVLVSERLTEDRGRVYVTLAAERGADGALYRHPTLSRADLLAAGPLLVRARTAAMFRYWTAQRHRLAAIVDSDASGAQAARARTALARARRILAAISKRGG